MSGDALLATLLGAVDDAVIAFDEEGRATRVNRSALQLLGLGEDEWCGQAEHDLIVPLTDRDRRALGNGQRAHLRRTGGSGVLVKARRFPIPGVGVLVLLTNMAAQTAIESENLQLFRAAQAQADDMFALYQISQLLGSVREAEDLEEAVLNELMRLVGAEAGALLLAYPHNDVQPMTWELAASEGVEGETSWSALLSGACSTSTLLDGGLNLAGGVVGDVHDPGAIYLPLSVHEREVGMLWLRAKAGSGFAKHDLRLLNTLAHEVALAILSRRAQRQLESERAKLSAIIDGASDGVVLVDEQRRVHVFNAALEALTGRPAAQTLGQTCVHALGCRDAAGLPGCEGGCPFERVLRAGTSLPYLETVLETAEGRSLTVAGSYAPVHGMADGHTMGVAIVRDVSRQKDAEQLKSTFIAMVSHELRTPLALIRGYTETLRHLDLDEGTRSRLVVELDEATGRLASIVDDVLDVSSFDAGGLRLRFQPVSVSALVHEVVAEHVEQAPEHRIITRCPGAPLTAFWDASRMRQVLANLISNAIKYSPHGGRILVRTWTEGDDVLLSVTDEGVGIARQDMPRLFRRFQRLEGSADRRAPGSGLGLYICRCIVVAHGGDIQAESPPPRHGGASLPPDWRSGTMFTVRVPRQTSAHGSVCEEATRWVEQPTLMALADEARRS